jgi:hypothetical protein
MFLIRTRCQIGIFFRKFLRVVHHFCQISKSYGNANVSTYKLATKTYISRYLYYISVLILIFFITIYGYNPTPFLELFCVNRLISSYAHAWCIDILKNISIRLVIPETICGTARPYYLPDCFAFLNSFLFT